MSKIMPCLNVAINGRISLVLLLIAATPMRPSPIDADPEQEQQLDITLADWNEGMDTARNSFRDWFENGRPLPKIEDEEEEMMPVEYDNELALPFNFPQHPMSLNRRRWDQQWFSQSGKPKQLQPTLQDLSQLQSPAKAESRRKLKHNHQLRSRNKMRKDIGDDTTNDRSRDDRKWKREPTAYNGPPYRPSISAGVMTNLGDFFKKLKANVNYAEHSKPLDEGDTQLLEGLHANHFDRSSANDLEEYDDTGQQPDRKISKSKLTESLLSYRPSQKIRSLVSRNPNGYRGSQFIDPSYMWLGLGK